MGKGRERAIADLLNHEDDWVRLESVRTLERIKIDEEEVLLKIAQLLQDPNVQVRKAAAHALGKIKTKQVNHAVIVKALHQAAEDENVQVRFKVQKALRLLGHYQN
jgi:HEAT repeat protein